MRSTAPSEFILVAARRSTFVQVADVLRNWSAIGLVSRVHVVDVDALRAGETYIPCTIIEDGRTTSTALQQDMAQRNQISVVRICAVSEVTDACVGPLQDEGLRLREAVQQALPGVRVVPIHLVGLTLQGAAPDPSLAWIGWHNVVLAPENSLSPTHGMLPVVNDPADAVRRSLLVGAVCSVNGLWTGRPEGVFDDIPLPPGRSLVAARTFSRHLLASQVETELMRRLADVSRGYPVPLLDGASLAVAEDQSSAAGEMADRVIAKHKASLLPRPRQQDAATPPRNVTLGEAVKMLFVFLWAAVRNAPRSFVEHAKHKIAGGVANRVQNLVFGPDDSEFSVVVRGVRSDGLPASWDEVEQALENTNHRLHPGGQHEVAHLAHVDLAPVWKDFVTGALTLIDAGSRSADLPPLESGARRIVVTDPHLVAPDPHDVFSPSEQVASYLDEAEVTANDAFASALLEPRLVELAQQQPHLTSSANQSLQDLRQWRAPHQRSYSGRIGRSVAEGLYRVRAEIGDLIAQLSGLSNQNEVPSQIEDQQRRLVRRIQLLALAGVVVGAVLAGLGFASVISWPVAGAGIAVALVLWFVSTLVVFLRGQRDLFALLSRRQQALSQIEMLNRHLQEALDDLRRVTRVYRQYKDWSSALGSFARAPLGTPHESDEAETLIGGGLPHNHRFGAARPDPGALDEVAARMRRELFAVGWASRAWEKFLADVPDEVGHEAYRIREEAELLHHGTTSAGQPLLGLWAAAVTARTQWPAGAEMVVERASEIIGGSGAGAELGARLLARVEARSTTGLIETIDRATFLSGLDTVGDGAAGQFDRRMFSDVSLAAEPWRVASTIEFASSRTGLARTLVVTQLSKGFQPYDLVGAGESGGQGSTTSPEPDSFISPF